MHALNSRFLAALHLCSGQSNIKKRLNLAWAEHLDAIKTEELPEILRGRFSELRDAMYARQPLPFESAPQASIRKMSAQQAADHVASIVTIYSELAYAIANTAAALPNAIDKTLDQTAAEKQSTRQQLNS